jgi:hypothetical protein
MRLLAVIPGIALILIILWEAFETIILPGRVSIRFRLTREFYIGAWAFYVFLAKRIRRRQTREEYLSLFGPLFLIVLLVLWAVGLVCGYATVQWALRMKLNAPEASVSFGTYLYLSGTTFLTLGYGDVTPLTSLGRAIEVLEAGTGFGLLAVVIGYLPVLYQSYSAREANITLLDARAGSPSSAAELLRRHNAASNLDDLKPLLLEWERWSAALLESHLSYPVLCYFRSMHSHQSWLAALTTVLDTCALVMVGVDRTSDWQARLTFAMARHAVVDIATIFRTAPKAVDCCGARLPPEDLARLREIFATNGVNLREGAEAEQHLLSLRTMYEPYVVALSEFLMMPLPPWILPPDSIDNWKTSAWGRIQ